MRFSELFRLTFLNLIQNKFKVLATSLGIIVGAVTIVLVIAIGKGGEAEAAKGFSDLSADTIYVNINYETVGFDTSKIEKLSPELVNKILEENPLLTGMYLRGSTYKEISVGREKEYVSISGLTEGWQEISGYTVSEGMGFLPEENQVIIGNGLAEKLFSGSAVGQKIKIGDKRYEVTGVLKRSADGLQGLNADETVFMDYGTMVKNEVSDEYTIPQAVGKVKNINKVKQAMAGITGSLDYFLQRGDSYEVEDAGSRIDAATESARTMKMLLISVAAIVFVVGGIGIMNVLFVTVKERTKEIGVLMALGTRRGQILSEFMLESIFMGVFSGGVGVLLSFFALEIMRGTNIPVLPSTEGMAIAFLFSVLTTAIFGFYPAFKASRLSPVEALNYE